SSATTASAFGAYLSSQRRDLSLLAAVSLTGAAEGTRRGLAVRVCRRDDSSVAQEVNAEVATTLCEERGAPWLTGRHVLAVEIAFHDLNLEASALEVLLGRDGLLG